MHDLGQASVLRGLPHNRHVVHDEDDQRHDDGHEGEHDAPGHGEPLVLRRVALDAGRGRQHADPIHSVAGQQGQGGYDQGCKFGGGCGWT